MRWLIQLVKPASCLSAHLVGTPQYKARDRERCAACESAPAARTGHRTEHALATHAGGQLRGASQCRERGCSYDELLAGGGHWDSSSDYAGSGGCQTTTCGGGAPAMLTVTGGALRLSWPIGAAFAMWLDHASCCGASQYYVRLSAWRALPWCWQRRTAGWKRLCGSCAGWARGSTGCGSVITNSHHTA